MILKNIHRLHCVAEGEARKGGASMADSVVHSDAWVRTQGDRIHSFGSMTECPEPDPGEETVDGSGRLVLPGFVDSHTHIVFARSREEEYVDRIRGLSYEEIARRGGGILNSARRLQAMSEEALLEGARTRAREVLRKGTTTLEIKSGYGLTFEDELKMLRVARTLQATEAQTIRTTFLGAHAIPTEYKDQRTGYIDLIVNEMLPAVSSQQLADFVDVFCDEGFFTVEETARILTAAAGYGLRPKIHANELANSGGVQVGIAHGALSVDHLERTGPDEIAALAASTTIPTVLPCVSFFLGIDYAPARQMIDAGLPLAIASDYNPGSSPAGDMQFIWSLACTKMGLLPEEALVAMTLNAAAALDLQDEVGSIEVGKRADLLVTAPMDSLAQLPYYPALNQIDRVMAGGKWVAD